MWKLALKIAVIVLTAAIEVATSVERSRKA